MGEVLDFAVKLGLVIKAGAGHSSAKGSRIGQGRDNTVAYLKENKELGDELEAKVRAKIFADDTAEEKYIK